MPLPSLDLGLSSCGCIASLPLPFKPLQPSVCCALSHHFSTAPQMKQGPCPTPPILPLPELRRADGSLFCDSNEQVR